jgi:tellurite methyltransferase
MSTIQHEREDFWQQYYAGKIQGDSQLVEQPSPFAEEVNANLDSGCSLLEIGCGNGRDSCFFASNDVVVVATDICEAAINLTASRLPKDCKALVANAKGLPDDVYADYAYARFVLHALTEEEQHDLFVWLKTHVKKKIFIETRSVNDPRCGKGKKVGNNAYVDTHYRRFMSPVDLQAAATEAGLLVDDLKDTTPGSGNDGARVVRATLSVA